MDAVLKSVSDRLGLSDVVMVKEESHGSKDYKENMKNSIAGTKDGKLVVINKIGYVTTVNGHLPNIVYDKNNERTFEHNFRLEGKDVVRYLTLAILNDIGGPVKRSSFAKLAEETIASVIPLKSNSNSGKIYYNYITASIRKAINIGVVGKYNGEIQLLVSLDEAWEQCSGNKAINKIVEEVEVVERNIHNDIEYLIDILSSKYFYAKIGTVVVICDNKDSEIIVTKDREAMIRNRGNMYISNEIYKSAEEAFSN